MSDQERRMQELEAQIPLASGDAFANAHQQAIQSGHILLQTIGSGLYEIHPDGTRRLIKQFDPPMMVKPGTRVKIR